MPRSLTPAENVSLSYSGAYSEADNYKAGKDSKLSPPAAARPATWRATKWAPAPTAAPTTRWIWRSNTTTICLKPSWATRTCPNSSSPTSTWTCSITSKAHQSALAGRIRLGQAGGNPRLYHETVKRYMDFGADKQFQYSSAPGMPMHTEGKTTGATVKAEISIGRAQPAAPGRRIPALHSERLVAGLRHGGACRRRFHQYQRRPAQPPGAVW